MGGGQSQPPSETHLNTIEQQPIEYSITWLIDWKYRGKKGGEKVKREDGHIPPFWCKIPRLAQTGSTNPKQGKFKAKTKCHAQLLLSYPIPRCCQVKFIKKKKKLKRKLWNLSRKKNGTLHQGNQRRSLVTAHQKWWQPGEQRTAECKKKAKELPVRIL